jgi:hypothetical protein
MEPRSHEGHEAVHWQGRIALRIDPLNELPSRGSVDGRHGSRAARQVGRRFVVFVASWFNLCLDGQEGGDVRMTRKQIMKLTSLSSCAG